MQKASWWLCMVVALGGCVFSSRQSRAEGVCPWLNAATAAGLLGGGVQMSVTAPIDPGPIKGVGQATYPDQIRKDRFDVSCVFTRKTGTSVDSLRIEVKTMNDYEEQFPKVLERCPGKTVALKGIGNEAFQCTVHGTGSGLTSRTEQVIARVRDRYFILTLNRESNPPASALPQLRDDTRNIAEQVAGSLF